MTSRSNWNTSRRAQQERRQRFRSERELRNEASKMLTTLESFENGNMALPADVETRLKMTIIDLRDLYSKLPDEGKRAQQVNDGRVNWSDCK